MRFGVTLCLPDDSVVVRKFVCYSYRSAVTRGRQWKRRHPDHIVRVISLVPRDTSEPEVIKLIPLFNARTRAPLLAVGT